MERNNKYLLIISVLFFSILLFLPKSFANESKKFLSLKNNEVNLRQGPSFEYPIKFIYIKKYLPVEVLDKSETWIKIRDFENNSGWVHTSQLSKKKSAICKKKNSVLYKKPTVFSKPLAILEIGRLVLVKKCKLKWCKISSGNFSGWIYKNSLWGKIK